MFISAAFAYEVLLRFWHKACRLLKGKRISMRFRTKRFWDGAGRSLPLVGIMLLLTACGEKIEPVSLQPESIQSESIQTESVQTEGIQTENLGQPDIDAFKSFVVNLVSQNETGKISGSGFIAEITEDTVYICTNQHVIQSADTWTVTFGDGTQAEGEKLGCSQMFDVGVVKVEKGRIAAETVEKLQPVKVDLEEWCKARDNADSHVTVKVYRAGEEGLTGECQEGTVESVMAPFEYGNGLNHTKMDIILESGDSGSAVFDENGNLFSMVVGVTYEEDSKPARWGIPLTSVITSYKEITGREWIPLF